VFSSGVAGTTLKYTQLHPYPQMTKNIYYRLIPVWFIYTRLVLR